MSSLPNEPWKTVPGPKHGAIFISYRRKDDQHFAGRLYDKLVSRFGGNIIFMDVNSIEAGQNFSDALDKALNNCRVMLVLIGRKWNPMVRISVLSLPSLLPPRRIRRTHYANDYIRVEVERALERNIRVIPVLVDGAAMPAASELPDSLKPLADRQSCHISHASFASDVQALITTLERVLE